MMAMFSLHVFNNFNWAMTLAPLKSINQVSISHDTQLKERWQYCNTILTVVNIGVILLLQGKCP